MRRWLNQSTHSVVANSTSSTPFHGAWGLMISVLNSPLIVSARALSQLEPTDPTEAAMPSSESRSDKEIKVYWAGSTGRCSTLVWEVSVVAARYWSVEASEVPGGVRR